jgi:hypothetical protein
MKITSLTLGLFLAAGAALLAGASTQEAQLSTPSRKESPSPSLSDKGKGRGSAPDAPELGSYGRHYIDDTVVIVGVTEQKPDASGSRKVTVRVQYALVHYPKGVVSLGFNLKSATKIAQVANQPVMAGTEEIELSATIVPVTWPKAQPFKLSVSLSAEPHPGQWSLLAAATQVMKPAAAPVAAKGGEAK